MYFLQRTYYITRLSSVLLLLLLLHSNSVFAHRSTFSNPTTSDVDEIILVKENNSSKENFQEKKHFSCKSIEIETEEEEEDNNENTAKSSFFLSKTINLYLDNTPPKLLSQTLPYPKEKIYILYGRLKIGS